MQRIAKERQIEFILTFSIVGARDKYAVSAASGEIINDVFTYAPYA